MNLFGIVVRHVGQANVTGVFAMLRPYFDRSPKESNHWTWVFVSFGAVVLLVVALAVIAIRLWLRL
jgi:hypothetical protein